MMKKVTLRELRAIVRRLVEHQLDDELNTVEVGDTVDVDVDEIGILPVRVLELVDDVNTVAGPEDSRKPGKFSGPGFVGEIDPESGESGRLVFSMNQVLPGSKAKGYFPKMGEDEYGRDVPNPYRKMARRFATKAIEPEHSYVAGLPDDLEEADEDHEGDARWDDHADPTGKDWSFGLE